jgi:aminopeptidase
MIQRKDYGGGEIWFDNRLIRKDGEFVIPELRGKFTRKALGG